MLASHDSFDYLPSHSCVYREWLQRQPARYVYPTWRAWRHQAVVHMRCLLWSTLWCLCNLKFELRPDNFLRCTFSTQSYSVGASLKWNHSAAAINSTNQTSLPAQIMTSRSKVDDVTNCWVCVWLQTGLGPVGGDGADWSDDRSHWFPPPPDLAFYWQY